MVVCHVCFCRICVFGLGEIFESMHHGVVGWVRFVVRWVWLVLVDPSVLSVMFVSVTGVHVLNCSVDGCLVAVTPWRLC